MSDRGGPSPLIGPGHAIWLLLLLAQAALRPSEEEAAETDVVETLVNNRPRCGWQWDFDDDFWPTCSRSLGHRGDHFALVEGKDLIVARIAWADEIEPHA